MTDPERWFATDGSGAAEWSGLWSQATPGEREALLDALRGLGYIFASASPDDPAPPQPFGVPGRPGPMPGGSGTPGEGGLTSGSVPGLGLNPSILARLRQWLADAWQRLQELFSRAFGTAGRWLLLALLAALAAFLAVRYLGARADTAGRRG